MFGSLALLFGNQRRIVRKAFLELNWATAVVAAVFVVIGAGIFVGAYVFFLRSFQALLAEPLAGPLIARYVLESSFSLIFLLGAMSFVVSSVNHIFRADEVRFLAAMPVDPLAVFIYRFSGAALLAAWPVIFLGLPAIIALGVASAASAAYYLFCAIVLLLFVFFIAVTGGLLSFLAAWLTRFIGRSLLWIVEAAFFLALLFGLIRRIIPRSLFTLFNVGTPEAAAAAGDRLSAIFRWFPSHPFAEVVSLVLPGSPTGRPVIMLVLLNAALIAVAALILIELGRRYFLPVWRIHEEGGFLARPEDAPARAARRPFPRLFRWRYGYLFEKDCLMLFRNAEDLSRAGFLLMLMIVYVLAARAISVMEAFGPTELYAAVVAFAFAAIGYFALTIGMRFVFPSLSLEGKSAWVLWSSPVHIHEFFSWKFFFWSAAVGLPITLAAAVTALLFGLPLWLGVFFVYAAMSAAVSLTAVTLGQGSIFPNFRDRDPDTLSTSPAGLAAAAIGLAYIWIVAGYVRRFTLAYLLVGQIDTLSIFGILIVSWAVITIYWIAAPRAMDRIEFPG